MLRYINHKDLLVADVVIALNMTLLFIDDIHTSIHRIKESRPELVLGLLLSTLSVSFVETIRFNRLNNCTESFVQLDINPVLRHSSSRVTIDALVPDLLALSTHLLTDEEIGIICFHGISRYCLPSFTILCRSL